MPNDPEDRSPNEQQVILRASLKELVAKTSDYAGLNYDCAIIIKRWDGDTAILKMADEEGDTVANAAVRFLKCKVETTECASPEYLLEVKILADSGTVQGKTMYVSAIPLALFGLLYV